MSRRLVSYDDLVPPQSGAGLSAPTPTDPAHPPTKRQKRNQHYVNKRQAQHWDDPSGAGPSQSVKSESMSSVAIPSVTLSSLPAKRKADRDVNEEEEEDEDCELTHDEIWDDSALVDAWNAAQEEYHLLNGPEKDWKKEPVNKSALWYHVPSNKRPLPTRTETEEVASTLLTTDGNTEEGSGGSDSKPFDFHSFVPSHDAGLGLPPTGKGVATGPEPGLMPMAGLAGGAPIVGRDEAFQNALSAMYWTGYWTAAYYYQRGAEAEEDEEEEEEEEEVAEAIEVEDDQGFLSTQR